MRSYWNPHSPVNPKNLSNSSTERNVGEDRHNSELGRRAYGKLPAWRSQCDRCGNWNHLIVTSGVTPSTHGPGAVRASSLAKLAGGSVAVILSFLLPSTKGKRRCRGCFLCVSAVNK
jgi:hypothetical protein